MNRIKTTFKSFAYSFKLILESSNILIFIYGALQLISTSIPLLSAFLLKLILDELTAVTPDIGKIISVVVIYGLSLVLLQGVNSASSVINNNITHKAKHLYQTRLCRRLTELPMDIVDSSAGRDMADNVRYTEHATIRQTFNFIRIFTNVYSCVVAFSTLALFSLEFSLLFLIITLPSVIYSEHFAIKAEKLREKTAPDVRKFSYYRWMLTDAWPAKDVRMYDLTDAIKDSEYMILDEPSAALDPISEDRIFEQLYHLSEGKSSVTISHRLSNTTLADKILVISDGHIIEQGSHFELLKQNGKYAELFNLQASKYI